ncbi:rhodanese-like domain-containing protein [Acaryochloris marina NIES-2412]|uniref:rhodanese-like domain-containing protein n=1 Tax=Acaryochloris marina TaxID=155978 RepID=UPI004057E25E
MTFAMHNLNEIDALTLKQWMDRNEVLLIDVSKPQEFEKSHIPGAKLMPIDKFDPTTVPRLQGQRIVLQCQTGNRSTQAAHQMLQAGFSHVIHLQGGLAAWKAAGYPTQGKRSINILRLAQILTGSCVLLGTSLGSTLSPWFVLLSIVVGGSLVLIGVSND